MQDLIIILTVKKLNIEFNINNNANIITEELRIWDNWIYSIHQARTHLAKDFPIFLKGFELFLKNCDIEFVDNPSPEEVKKHQNLVRDKKDIPIALSAINARVDYLVIDDKDLTIKDNTTKELRQFVQTIICGTFLKEVMGWTSEDLEKNRRRNWQDTGT